MEDKKQLKPAVSAAKAEAQPLPQYEPPQVTTYTDEELLEMLGPAQTVYGPIDP